MTTVCPCRIFGAYLPSPHFAPEEVPASIPVPRSVWAVSTRRRRIPDNSSTRLTSSTRNESAPMPVLMHPRHVPKRRTRFRPPQQHLIFGSLPSKAPIPRASSAQARTQKYLPLRRLPHISARWSDNESSDSPDCNCCGTRPPDPTPLSFHLGNRASDSVLGLVSTSLAPERNDFLPSSLIFSALR